MDYRGTRSEGDRASSPSEQLGGLIECATFHNVGSGFCVLRLKVRGQRDLIALIGQAPLVSAGKAVQATVSWTNNRDHGLHFEQSSCA